MESSSTAVEAGAPRHSKIDDDNDDDDDDHIHINVHGGPSKKKVIHHLFRSPWKIRLHRPIPFGVQKLEFPHL